MIIDLYHIQILVGDKEHPLHPKKHLWQALYKEGLLTYGELEELKKFSGNIAYLYEGGKDVK